MMLNMNISFAARAEIASVGLEATALAGPSFLSLSHNVLLHVSPRIRYVRTLTELYHSLRSIFDPCLHRGRECSQSHSLEAST